MRYLMWNPKKSATWNQNDVDVTLYTVYETLNRREMLKDDDTFDVNLMRTFQGHVIENIGSFLK